MDLLAQQQVSMPPVGEWALLVASSIYALDRVLNRLGVGVKGVPATGGCNLPPCAELQVLISRFESLEQKVEHSCDGVDRLRTEIQNWRLEQASNRPRMSG